MPAIRGWLEKLQEHRHTPVPQLSLTGLCSANAQSLVSHVVARFGAFEADRLGADKKTVQGRGLRRTKRRGESPFENSPLAIRFFEDLVRRPGHSYSSLQSYSRHTS